MTRHLIVAFLVAAGCSSTPTPEQACKNLADRCGEPSFPAKALVDCPSLLPKAKTELSDADYTKLLRCVSDADGCLKAMGCFADAGATLGGTITRSVLDDVKK